MFRLLSQNSFILTLIALSLLCLALHEKARADVKGLPYNEKFATAAYPHARSVAGCTDWRRPDRMTDDWGPVSFAGACVQHDRCFHTPGETFSQCNIRFQADLRAACDRDLARAKLGGGRVGPPDAQAVKLCYDIADLYLRRAQDLENARRFQLAQKQEQEYLAWVRTVVGDVYRSVLRRDATSKEKDQALTALAQDYSLDDLKAALMGQKLDEDAAAPQLPRIDDTAPVMADGARAPEAGATVLTTMPVDP